MGSHGHGEEHGSGGVVGTMVLAVALVGYAVGWMSRPTMEVWAQPQETPPPGYSDPVPAKGPAESAVIVHEVADYKCIHCASRYGFVKRLAMEHKDVRFVFKHFPFVAPPLQSQDAAIAAMAAHRQGKFWDYSRLLYIHRTDTWKADTLERYASGLGMDMGRFKQDMLDPELCAYVQNDKKAAGLVMVNATPALFVNGRQVSSLDSPADFRRLVREARESVHRLLRTGKAKTMAEARALDAATHYRGGFRRPAGEAHQSVQRLLRSGKAKTRAEALALDAAILQKKARAVAERFAKLYMNNDGRGLSVNLEQCFHARRWAKKR